MATQRKLISGDHGRTILIKSDGTVWGCGNSNSGQLGMGNALTRNTLNKIPIDNVVEVSCGYWQTSFLKNDGTVWASGGNPSGEMGFGISGAGSSKPIKVPIGNVEKIICGYSHTIYFKNDGTVWGCGDNTHGLLGLGTTGSFNAITHIPISDVVMAACGYYHTVFLKKDGTVWACGLNNSGQLGLGDVKKEITPVQIDITDIEQVICGYYHTIFLKSDGTVWGCGQNVYGELGLEDTANKTTPVQLAVTNVKQVACGGSHTILIKNDGTVWSCGYNHYGQLGQGDRYTKLAPVQINITDVMQVICGDSYTVFLKNDGTVWGCGANNYGQLGINYGVGEDINLTPVQADITLFDLFLLLRDMDRYKTVSGTKLQNLSDETLTVGSFQENGFSNIQSITNVYDQLSSAFEVLRYSVKNTNTAIQVTHLPAGQLVTLAEDISLLRYTAIRNITLTATGTAGIAKVILSFDGGVSWRTYTDGWRPIACTPEALSAGGMTAEALNSIPSEQWTAAVTGPMRVAYYLAKSAVTDDLAVAQLAITGNTVVWDKARHMTDYDYEYPNTATLVVKLLTDGSYKMNYLSGS